MVRGDGGERGDRLAVKFGILLAHLDERARRLYSGSEALALEGELGREWALAQVAGAAGVSSGAAPTTPTRRRCCQGPAANPTCAATVGP